MKYLFSLTVIILSLPFWLNAQNKQLISSEMLESMHKTFQDTKPQALQNAIRNNSINDLANTRNVYNTGDTYFSNRVKTKGITNQKQSGRCWLFTGLNVLRPIVIEKYKLGDFEFSQSYLFFYDQLEKSNLFLVSILESANLPMEDRKVDWLFKNPIGDGGQWTGVVDLIEKYGLVPSEIMPESYQAENTGTMSKLLSTKLREQGLKLRKLSELGKSKEALDNERIAMLSDIYQILALSLGEPVQKFQYRYKDTEGKVSELKEYTPQAFYKEFVNVNLSEYVMLMNDPSRAYNQLYEIEYDRHRVDGRNWKYINLDIDQIKSFAKASIIDNQAMYFSCDVGKQLDSKKGYLDLNNYDYNSLMGVNFDMTKAERISTFASSSSHGMTLVAVDIDQAGQIKKWLLENSWGDSGFQGHLIMSDEWFSEYMFRVVIHKKYIEPEVLKVLNQKPIVLPPWDPMFSPEL
jgi:bleomycin hydrolase